MGRPYIWTTLRLIITFGLLYTLFGWLGGAAVERSASDQQAAGGSQVQFPPGRPVTKSRSTAELRVAAVGKLFTLIALTGVVAVHEGYGSRLIMAPTCKPRVAALHVRHLLIHVELLRSNIVKLVRLSWVIIKATLLYFTLLYTVRDRAKMSIKH